MIKITDSTVFNTGADCIVNTINCVGFMGRGLALEFALRYPELDKKYIEQCKNKKIHIGEVYYYEIDGQKIINFPTKFHFRYPSQMDWVKRGLQYFADNYKSYNISSIAFPLLGANNGGLNPKSVEEVMIKYLSPLDIDVYICHSTKVEGKELEMTNAFNATPIDEIKKSVRLTNKQYQALLDNQNKIKRFSDLLKIDGIGIDTYKSIYNLFYYEQDKTYEQLKLF